MNIPKKEVLSARLMDDVYKKLNLVDSGFSEFYFKEMVDIVNVPGMDQWPTTLETFSTKFLFSLVCFSPPNAKGSSQLRPLMRHQLAHQLSLGMLNHCFPEKNDRSSIKIAMDNFPSIAIFMSPLRGLKQKKRNQKFHKTKSILDYECTSCLAVLNYFRDEKQTQVLWLATTLLEPPQESIHVTWRNKGLATYLLSILVKQHTGIGDGSLENSIISLQASMDRENPARRFYLNLGFTDHNLPDNGFSLTSPSFQTNVNAFPELWIPADAQKMSLFKLYKGHLQTPHAIVDLTMDVSVSPKKSSWKTYGYSRFPYEAKSMKTIELFAEFCPILNSLSLD
jgi:hypothetical protein